MKKFLVLYLVAPSVLASWKSTDNETKQIEEEKMKKSWGLWMKEHGDMLRETTMAGATKKVTRQGIHDSKNEIALFSFVEAESQEEVAEAFKNHPHLEIPETSIEIMPLKPMPDMG